MDFLKDLLFPVCFDAQVVPFGKINFNHRVEWHESDDDTQLHHLSMCSEFFSCPELILDGDLQMGKTELPCLEPRENRMLMALLIQDSCECVPTYTIPTCREFHGGEVTISLSTILEKFTSL